MKVLGASSRELGATRRILGVSSRVLGASRRVLGASRRVLRVSRRVMGASSMVLGAKLGRSWVPLAHLKKLRLVKQSPIMANPVLYKRTGWSETVRKTVNSVWLY